MGFAQSVFLLKISFPTDGKQNTLCTADVSDQVSVGHRTVSVLVGKNHGAVTKHRAQRPFLIGNKQQLLSGTGNAADVC